MFKDLNTYDLPMWAQRYWEKIQNECFFTLREECDQYIDLQTQYERMQDEHDFISKIIDRDAITDPFTLEEAEVKLLAEFLAIMSDKREIEEMKMYVMGCRDAYRLLRGMKIIE